jgi:cytochrome b6-f complex iron-sulfur subunit
VNVGSVGDVEAAFARKEPFYNASAKVYIQPYPEEDIKKARAVYGDSPAVLAGMEEGFVALYQKCPHLGCRVPWCQTSQWFECPCHGSKYNRVGEKKGGPAPRGMDRFPVEVSGNAVLVDTAVVVPGPPIGTDTTGQGQEGAACV